MTVYCKVRSQANKARKWSMGNKGLKKGGARNVLERTVFYQSIFYVMSFLISWPILFAMYLASVDVDGPYGLTATIAFVAPLQGFNNFLVYIRPKINQWRRERQKLKEKKQKLFNSSTAATAGATGTSATGGFFRRLRGSRGSSVFRLSSKFSIFKKPSKEFEGIADSSAVGISNISSVTSNTNASCNLAADISMSNFDQSIDGLNESTTLSQLGNSSTASTVENSFTTTHDDLNLESDEFETEDPSVLIARADLDQVLKKHEVIEERKQQQEQRPQQQNVHPKTAVRPSTGVVVPETVDEEGDSDLISSDQISAPLHTVASMPDTIAEEKEQAEHAPAESIAPEDVPGGTSEEK